MSDSRPFILLATQRTGSSWVQEMLNSHPEIRVHTELFLAGASGYPRWEPSQIEFLDSYLERHMAGAGPIARSYWRLRYLRRIFQQPGIRAVGFKFMYDQIRRSPEVMAYAAARQVGVVHLIRRNLLDTVISAKLAATTGLYHLAGDARTPVPWWPSKKVETTVRLHVPDVLRELDLLTRERRRIRAWLRVTRTPVCELEYEALAANRYAFAPVLVFLGLSERDTSLLDSGLQKLQTRPQTDVLENFTEVREALRPTPYGVFVRA